MNFLLAILKGFGQVLFQESSLFGLLIAVGLAVVSPVTLLLALIGNITGVFVAYFLGVQKSLIETGVFGFNGVLIGSMVSFYIKPLPIALVVTVVASIFAAGIFYLLFRNHLTPFAAPFVLAAWGILVLLKFLKP